MVKDFATPYGWMPRTAGEVSVPLCAGLNGNGLLASRAQDGTGRCSLVPADPSDDARFAAAAAAAGVLVGQDNSVSPARLTCILDTGAQATAFRDAWMSSASAAAGTPEDAELNAMAAQKAALLGGLQQAQASGDSATAQALQRSISEMDARIRALSARATQTVATPAWVFPVAIGGGLLLLVLLLKR